MSHYLLDEYVSMIINDAMEVLYKAQEIREKNFGTKVSFSRNYFVPVTRQCRNNCAYCSFASPDPASWISPTEYLNMIKTAKSYNCTEILLTLGEKPEQRYESAREFLNKYNFSSTVDYVKYLAEIALKNNLLPHSNLGVLSYEELRKLKEVNASMGLMLESSSRRLLKKGKAHYRSPGKDPLLRLKTIEYAGKLKIPFTSGILVGIGEDWHDRIKSLIDLAHLSNRFHHIQEIIIQNFNPQKGTPMARHPPPSEGDLLLITALARIIMPEEVSIQVPPNLNKDNLIDLLTYGANDIGGISPVTPDFINPNEQWPDEKELYAFLKANGYHLFRRLPVYPKYKKYLNRSIIDIIEG